MAAVDFFNSLDYLEPKCPGCSARIDYGVTTEFNEVKQVHVCSLCGRVV